jgi:hypothetical protein
MCRPKIVVYCKHHLLSHATATTDYGYYFDGDAIHTLRRIEEAPLPLIPIQVTIQTRLAIS